VATILIIFVGIEFNWSNFVHFKEWRQIMGCRHHTAKNWGVQTPCIPLDWRLLVWRTKSPRSWSNLRHCLHVLTAETIQTIKIWKFCTIHFLIL